MSGKSVEIAGLKLKIHQRRALDVIELTEFSRANNSDTDKLYQVAMIARDGLKPNLKECRWWQLIRKRRIKKILQIGYLLREFDIQELDKLAKDVLAAEGLEVTDPGEKVKKKSVISQITG